MAGRVVLTTTGFLHTIPSAARGDPRQHHAKARARCGVARLIVNCGLAAIGGLGPKVRRMVQGSHPWLQVYPNVYPDCKLTF